MSISVLMSVYRSEKADFLNVALTSVCERQTLLPDQLVLVEDGPLGDDLLKVIDQWKEKLGEKMVIVKNPINLGLTKSLNKGIEFCTSDLIARMDSDDISEPQRFELQSKYLENHVDIDIVGGSLREFNDTHKELRVRHYPQTDEEVRNYICKASPLAHPTVMMRRRIFDGGLKYNEKYRMSQDIALWFDAILAGYKISNVSEITINFRSQDDVFKRRSRAKAWNEFKIYMNGIYRMYGLFTLKYSYPIARLCFRLLPPQVVKLVYGSRIRSHFLETRNNKVQMALR